MQKKEGLTGSDRYRVLFNNSLDAIVLVDIVKVKIADGNKAAEKLLGYSRKELIGLPIPKTHSKEWRNRGMSIFKGYVSGKKKGIVELNLINKKGINIFVSANIVKTKIEGNEYLLAIMRDITEQKKSEKDRLFKKTLLEAQAEAAIDGILIVDENGKSLLLNQRFGKMWNIPKKILETKNDKKMLQHAVRQLKDPKKFIKKVQYLYRNKKDKSRDEIELKDGRIFDRYSSPVLDAEGEYRGRVWYFRDITEKREAEGGLERSEQKFLQTFEQAAVGMAHATFNGDFIRVNKKFCDIVGYSQKELVKKNFKKITYPEDLEKNVSNVKKILNGPIDYFSMEKRYIRKDKSIVWANLTVSLVNGKKKYLLAVIEDITKKKEAEKELRKAQERSNLAEGVAHIGVWDWDILTNTLEWTDEIYRIFGLRPQQFGATYEAFLKSVHPDDRSFVIESVNAAVKNNKKYSIDHRIVLPNKSVKWVSEQGTVFRDKTGKAIRMIGLVQDITERRRTQQELQINLEELEKFRDVTVGRELKMVQLKKRVAKLEEKLKGKSKKNGH